MPRTSLIDRVVFGIVSVLLLVLGIYLVVDSAKQHAFEFRKSFQVLMLAIAAILSLVSILRARGGAGADDEGQVEEL